MPSRKPAATRRARARAPPSALSVFEAARSTARAAARAAKEARNAWRTRRAAAGDSAHDLSSRLAWARATVGAKEARVGELEDAIRWAATDAEAARARPILARALTAALSEAAHARRELNDLAADVIRGM